jgi:hypothetical protein
LTVIGESAILKKFEQVLVKKKKQKNKQQPRNQPHTQQKKNLQIQRWKNE